MKIDRSRYHHIGLPTTTSFPGEIYLSEYDVYVSDHENNDCHVQWMRYGENSELPEVVKKVAHVAFEVDDIYEAIKGKEVIIEPNKPAENVIVAFILVNGAPVELLQFIR